MAVFLAAVAMHGSSLPAGLQERMKEALKPAGIVELVDQGRVTLGYVDLGLWPGKSAIRTDNAVGVIAGDPLVCLENGPATREQSVAALLCLAQSEGGDVLKHAEGTFCGIVISLQGHRITAVTDKLGVRPVYAAQVGETLYLSSVQWALEFLSDVPKQPEWLAATEMAAFGYSLGNRTLFKGIEVLGAGEVLTVGTDSCQRRKYWDWATIPASGYSGQNLTEYIKRSFDTAVDDRIQGQGRVFASLSGGMDSRLVVARLREKDVSVCSLNYAPEGTLDLELGRLAAKTLGTDHFEYSDGAISLAERPTRILSAWRERHEASSWPQQPNLVWTGDGGSVGLGHVYLDEEIVRAARVKGPLVAAQTIQRINKYVVSPRMFVATRQELANAPLAGIINDLKSRPNVEPGRNCHMFFMLNDQRRHLVAHYESVHLRHFDVVLPFFDGRFLGAILGSEVDPFMAHGLYNDLMKLLPFGAGGVPWQAYPGHMPCPVQAPSNLRRQWEDGWSDPRIVRQQERKQVIKSLGRILSPSFPGQVLSRLHLTAACLAGLSGRTQYNYLIKAIAPYEHAYRYS